ncbi:MAG: tRNA epoxyqueuosine(34) reductase QueG [Anaerolineae bacterium]|nr:tRNA epoxyqueuosine(34) reductase QueG [Anaerolineae bacterium]
MTSSSDAFSAARIKQEALALGFNLAAIVPAQPSPFIAAYERWLAAGMHGEMGYMARPDRTARRHDLNVILPGVQTLIVVGLDYRVAMPEALLADPSRGRIASYAWGLDYHEVMLPRLDALTEWLAQSSPHSLRARSYVDTGAILERGHAYAGGLGFIGKNTMLIHPRRGSYFFLGEILTDLPCDAYDAPAFRASMCGTCKRCLRACPTDAFPQPHVLDARRCISYLTIEHKGWIERDLRPRMGNWLFGCDVCQDVCPFQRFAPDAGTESPLHGEQQIERVAPSVLDLLALDEETFAVRYAGTPIARIKRERLVRNAAIVAGNWGDPAVAAPLIGLLADSSPLVRGHAAWALGRLPGDDARAALAAAQSAESDERVREEIALALV